MKHAHRRHSLAMRAISWMVILSHLFWGQIVVAANGLQEGGSVGSISNVTGKAMIFRGDQPDLPVDVSFNAPVVLGDRIRTGAQSMLAVLVGEEALVSMKEFSEMKVVEEQGLPRLVHLLNGQVCVSTKQKGEPVTVEVPGTTISVNPGSMASIQVIPQSLGSSPPLNTAKVLPSLLHRTTFMVPEGEHVVQANPGENEDVVINVKVGEGSVSLVSHAVGKVPVVLQAKQAVKIVGNSIGQPYESPELHCRVQDVQQDPQHTATPKQTKEQIIEVQQRQANQLVQILHGTASSVGASISQPPLPVPPVINNEVIPTTPNPEGGGEDVGAPIANPGESLVQSANSLLNINEPFLVALPGSTTIDGPPVILALNNFSGSLSDIDPAILLENFTPQAASELFSAFQDPNNPDALMAGLRVQSSQAEGGAKVFGGLQLTDSEVSASSEFVQIGQSGSAQSTTVQLFGALLELENSTFAGEEVLIALRNAVLNAQESNQPFVILTGQGSALSLQKSLLTTNPSTLMAPNGALLLQDGSTVTINGSVVELNGSTWNGTGGERALVTVEGGSELTVQGPIISAQNGSTVNLPGGVLSVNGSEVNIGQDFVVLDNANVQAPNGLIQARNNSLTTIEGYVLALNGNASVTTNGVPAVTLAGSRLVADGFLHMTTSGAIPLGLLDGFVQGDAGSTLHLREAVVKVENTTGVTLNSLSVLEGLGAVPLLAESSEVTLAGYVAEGSLGALPSVTLMNSTLTAMGLFKMTGPGAVPTDQLANIVDTNGTSTLALTEAVVKVENATGVTLNSLSQLQGFGALPLLVDNSEVLIDSDLVEADGTLVTVPNSGLGRATNNSTLTVGGYLVALRNGGGVITNGEPLIELNGSTLVADGLLKVNNQGVPTALLEGLIQTNEVRMVQLNEAVLNVENSDVVLDFLPAPLGGAPFGLLAENSIIRIDGFVENLEHVRLVESSLSVEGLQLITQPGDFSLSNLSSLINPEREGDTVLSFDTLVKVQDTEGVTLSEVQDLLTLPVTTDRLLVVDNSEVSIPGDLVVADGETVTIPENGLLEATNNSTVTLDGYVTVLSNGGEFVRTGSPVISLEDSLLEAQGLVRLSGQENGFASPVIALGEGSSLIASDALVRVDSSSDITFADDFTNLLVDNPVELSRITANGGVLTLEESSVAVEGDFLHIVGAQLNGGANPLVSVLIESTLDVEEIGEGDWGRFLQLEAGSEVNAPGGVLTIDDSESLIDGNLIVLFDQNTILNGGDAPLVSVFNGSTLEVEFTRDGNFGRFLELQSGSEVQAPGGVLLADASDVTLDDRFLLLFDDNTLLDTGDSYLVTLQNDASLNTGGEEGGTLVFLGAGSTLMTGGLLSLTNQSGVPAGPLAELEDGSTLIASDALVRVTDTGTTDEPLEFGGNFAAPRNDFSPSFLTSGFGDLSRITANGGVLALNNSHVTIEEIFLPFSVSDGEDGMVPGPFTTGGLIHLANNSSLSLGEDCDCFPTILDMDLSSEKTAITSTDTLVTVEDSMLDIGSGFGTAFQLFDAQGETDEDFALTITNGGLLTVVDSQGEAEMPGVETGDLLWMDNSSLKANDTLVTTTNSSVHVGFEFIHLENESELTGSGAILSVENDSRVVLGDDGEGGFSAVWVEDSTLTVDDTAIQVNNSSLEVEGSAFTVAAFFSDEESTVEVTQGGLLSLVDVQDSDSVRLGGSVLEMQNSRLTADQTLVTATNSQLSTGRSVIRLQNFEGGESLTVTNGGLVDLTNESSLMIQNGGVLEAFNETVNAGATLVTLSQSSLTMDPGFFDIDLIDLADSNLTSSGGILSLSDESQVTIQPGNEIDNDVLFLDVSDVEAGQTLVTVTGDSHLITPGDTFGMIGFSSLNVTGGGLLEIVDAPGSLIDNDPGVDVSVVLNLSGSNNSVTTTSTLVSVQNSSLVTGDALILLLNSFGSNSIAVSAGGLLAIQNSSGDLSNGLPGVALADSVLSAETPELNVHTSDTWVRVDNSTLSVRDTLFFIGPDSSSIDVTVDQGGLLAVTNSLGDLANGLPGVAINDDGLGVSLGDGSAESQFNLVATATLVSVEGSTLALGGSLFNFSAGTENDDSINWDVDVSGGGLLSIVNSSGDLAGGLPGVAIAGDGLNVSSSNVAGGIAEFDLSTTGTLVTVDASTFTLGGDLLNFTTDSAEAEGKGIFDVSEGGVLAVQNSPGNLAAGLPGVGIGGSILHLEQTLDLSTSTFFTHNTLVTITASNMSVGGTAFHIEGFPFDDGENFVESVQITNGGLLSLSNGSQFGGDVIDGQLVAATMPLLKLIGSAMKTGAGFLDVNTASTFSANLPADALVALDASSLTIQSGSLVSVSGGGSSVGVIGDLVSLVNGSTLNINNGFLVSVLNEGTFTLNGALINFGIGEGAGGNTFNLTNPTLCAGCTVNSDFAVPILLRPGADINNVSINGDLPFPGESSSGNSLNLGDNQPVLELGPGGSIDITLPLNPG